MGNKLIVIHVDFSRAFDSVNRNILFYKLNKFGFKGRVINTLFDIYKKTSFKIKWKGLTSEPISEHLGVNQGSITSPFLFKAYLSDLKEYLDTSTGVCIGNEILVHILWADDLFMVADNAIDSQKQLDGLSKFCSPNHMISNSIKTKFMIYGSPEPIKLYLNGNQLEQVDEYKSLGTILNTIKTVKGDMFRLNAEYLNKRARSATFGIKQKLKHIGNLPPTQWFHVYQTMIEPILLYGSDLWGSSLQCTLDIDKIYLWFIRIILNIKATTSNIITMGESGIIPPKIKCHQNIILYFIRLNSMPFGSVVKNVFLELKRMHGLGFKNWYSKVLMIAKNYKIDIVNANYSNNVKIAVKNDIKNVFIETWKSKLQSLTSNSSLRTYRIFKNNFEVEPYLTLIKKTKYLTAFARFRAGSHTLEIERGRYTNPRTPIEERLCASCNTIEDEKHFLIKCKMYSNERDSFYRKIYELYPLFSNMCDDEKFIYLMKNTNAQILSWTGKFIHDSMFQRSICHILPS